MADDNILRVGAEFDVAPIVSGAQAASTAFEQVAAKATAMGQATVAAAAPVDQLAVKLKAQGLTSAEITSVLQNLGYSQKEAATATEQLGEATTAAIVPATSLAAAIDALNASTERFILSRSSATDGVRSFSGSMGEARVVMGGLEGSTGMMAGGLARIAAQSEILGPLIAAAFPIFGIVAFVSILDLAADKIVELTESIEGWDKAAQKAYSDVEAANIALLRTNLEQASQQQKQNEIGLDGLAKQRQSLTNITADIQRYNAAAMDAQHAVLGIQDQIAKLKAERLESAFDPTKFNFATLGKDIEEQNRQLQVQTKLRDELTAKVRTLQIEQEAAGKTTAADRARAAITEQIAQAEAARTTQQAEAAFTEDVTKREYEMHHISLTQETADLQTQETRKIEILRQSFAAQQTELEARHKTTGEDIGPQMAKLNAEREAAETAHLQRMYDIQQAGQQEQFRLDEQAALHRVEIDKQIAAADDELATKRAEAAFQKADTVPTIQAGGVELIKAQTAAIEDQIRAIQQENAVLDRGTKNPQGQLADPAEAEKFAENVAKINALRLEQSRVAIQTTEETTRRVHELQAQQLTDETGAVENEARRTEDAYRRQEETVRTSFEDRSITSRKYLQESAALASQEYAVQAAAIAHEMEMVKAAADAQIITEEEKAKRLEALWKQEQEAHDRSLQQMAQVQDQTAKREEESIRRLAQTWNQDITRMTNELLTMRQKASVTFQEIGRDMELQLIDRGIQLVVTKTASYLLELIAKHSAFLASLLGIQTANNATQIAEAVAANTEKSAAVAAADVAEVVSYAAVGAAAAAAAAAAGGPLAAAAAAAETDAVILAFVGQAATTAERGGILAQDGPLFAHAKEMVLPAHISTAMQGAVPAMTSLHEAVEGGLTQNLASVVNNSNRSETRSVGPHRNTINVHFNGGSGNLKHDDIIASVQEGIRRGELRGRL